MSVYVLDRKQFVKIANFVAANAEGYTTKGVWVYHPDMKRIKGSDADYLQPHEVANALLIGNLESVAYRYNEPLEKVDIIRIREVSVSAAPSAAEIFGILACLDYQSCEPKDYKDSLAYAVIIAVLWLAAKVVEKQAGVMA